VSKQEEVEKAVEAVKEKLGNLIDTLKKTKVKTVELSEIGWLDDYNGRPAHYITYHGVELSVTKEQRPELRSLVKELLKIAEIPFDTLEIYATIEDGLTIQLYRDAINPYGRCVGTERSIISLGELVRRASEKAGEFNVQRLRESLARLVSSLSSSA
jgi:hypothetical protein